MKFTMTIAVVALLAFGGLAACGNSDEDGGTTTGSSTNSAAKNGQKEAKGSGAVEPVPTIVVHGGAPVDGVEEFEYSAGEEVRFRVHSNEADEIHVHGYEVSKEIPAGRSTTISFPADIEGIFEVELHGSEELIAELRVNP